MKPRINFKWNITKQKLHSEAYDKNYDKIFKKRKSFAEVIKRLLRIK